MTLLNSDPETNPEPSENLWDCAIVGAGPAGGAAAWALARAGRSVVVLERSTWPRPRTCAGGVSPAIAAWFDFDWSPVVLAKATQLRLTWKRASDVAFDFEGGRCLWTVDRAKFDDFLIQKAIAAGAKFQPTVTVTGLADQGDQGDRVQLNTTAGPIAARYVIVADGPHGTLATSLGFERSDQRQAVILTVQTSDRPQEAWFDFGSLKNGIVWSLPGQAGERFVCAASFRGGAASERDLTQAAKAAAQVLGKITAEPIFFPLNLWDGDRELHRGRSLLAGEAAGILDPFSGEGVRPSLRTGLLAAEAIDAALADDPALISPAIAAYSDRVAAELGADWLWAKRLSRLYHTFSGVAYRVGTARPSLRSYIGKAICGEMAYAYLADRAAKRLASWVPGLKL